MLEFEPRQLRLLSIALLAMPNLVFLVGWLRLPYALLSAAALVFLFGRVRTLDHRRGDGGERVVLSRRTALGAGALCVAWVALSGTGGIGLQNEDHLKHNAMLFDLIHQRWPVVYEPQEDLVPERSPLVYYIAHYLVPALAGKLLGWTAANLVEFVQVLVGVGLVFLWLIRLVGPRSAGGAMGLLGYFVLASGLDVVGSPQVPWRHLEWWTLMQYSSNTTLLFWVPQHATIGWLAAALLWDGIHARAPFLYGAFVCALGLLWSPFVTLGLLPLLGLLLVRSRSSGPGRTLLRDLAVLLASATPVVLYLAERNEFVSAEALWESGPIATFVRDYLEFAIIEWILPLFPVLVLWPFVRDRVVLGVAVVTLAIVPLVKVPGDLDFVMRGSIPALFVLWVSIARHFTAVRRHAPLKKWLRAVYLTAMVLTVSLGALTAVYEIGRAIAWHEIGTPELTMEPQVPKIETDWVPNVYVGRPGTFSAVLGRR